MAGSTAEAVGSAVRAELARQRRSQQWLAEQLDITQAGVSRRILGKVPFDINELVVVADALELDVHTLLPSREPAAA